MEESRPPIGETSEEDKLSRKKRKASERIFSLSDYLNPELTKGLENKEKDDDDEEKEENPKESRFRRLWSRIFGRIAPVEEQKPVAVPIVTEASPSPEWRAVAPEEPVEIPSRITEDQEPVPERAEEQVTKSTPETPKTPEPTEKAAEVPIVEPARADEAPSPERFGPMISPAADTLYQRFQEHPGEFKRKEVIVDRRSIWGPAIIVDQLARHRDRKLKREDRRIDREVQGLKKRAIEGDRTTTRLEQFAQTAKSQFETVRAQQQQFERRLEPIEPVIEKVRMNPEKEPEGVERVVEKRPEATPLPEITPEVAPIVVLQEVETAAEKNAPIEAAYEKRHEVKDESAQSQQFGASRVGQVLADLHQQTTAQHAAFSKVLGDQAKQPPKASPVSYKQAAISGFWTGLVIVGILLVIAIVT